MKNLLKWAVLSVLVLFVSCNKPEKVESSSLEPGFHGYIMPMPWDEMPDTKAKVSTVMQFSFDMGDRINIWSDSGTLLIYSVTNLTEGGGADFDDAVGYNRAF